MGEEKRVMSLSEVPSGKTVRLIDIMSGIGLKKRLAAMGLLPGVEIAMVQNNGAGPVVINVRNGRMVLGHGMALKMRVV